MKIVDWNAQNWATCHECDKAASNGGYCGGGSDPAICDLLPLEQRAGYVAFKIMAALNDPGILEANGEEFPRLVIEELMKRP